MDIQTIRINDNDYVVIAKADYENLISAKSEITRYHKIISLSGNEEALPHHLVKRLINENPLKIWREYRGLTMSALAKKVGVSQSYISDIENEKKDGSISVIKRISEILETDIDLLLPST